MRRRIQRIMVSLVVGAIVTIGVAWYFAFRQTHFFNFWTETPISLSGEQWMWPTDEAWPERPMLHYSWKQGMGERFDTQKTILNAMGPQSSYTLYRYSYGWPMLSLCSFKANARIQSITAFSAHLGRNIPTPEQNLKYESIAHGYVYANRTSFKMPLPLAPRPIGFVVCTLFYGSFMWLALFAITRFKQRRRLKRGCCIACAYPVENLETCPECGTPAGKKAGA